MNSDPTSAAEWIEWAKALAPPVAALIVFLGGFSAYRYQRKIDRQDKLREKKQAAYESYLHSLYQAAMERNRDAEASQARSAQGLAVLPHEMIVDAVAHDRYQETKLTVFVVASDEVVRAAGRYQKLVETTSSSGEARRGAFAELIAAMRSDSFEPSNLTIDEIVALSPINHN